MPVFTYSARPAAGGDIMQGEVSLSTKEEVMSFLHRQRLIPMSVREKPKKIVLQFGTGIKTRDIVIFTRQFATRSTPGSLSCRAWTSWPSRPTTRI